MKKSKKVMILGLCSLVLCGCGKIPTLSNGEDAVVTFKDGGISANDFYEEIKNTYGLQTLITMIDKYVFETEFADLKTEAEENAKAQVKAVKANYDSEEEFLNTLSYYNYKDEQAYQDYVYLSYLRNEGILEYAKDQITDKELEQYYEDNIYPNMTISHILITSNATSSSTDEEKEAAEKETKEKAEEIIKELNQAKKNKEDIPTKFAELAKEYSSDEATKEDGGNLGEINIGSLSSKYDELVKSAKDLKDGEYSSKVITTELGYHIILKTATGEKASYEDSLDSMKEDIANDNIDNDNTLITDALQYYRKKYDMEIIDSEMDSQYSTYMNNLINQYRNSTES